MAEFTPLERAALQAIMGEIGEDRYRVEEQLRHAWVSERENTGGGFFSDLSVASDAHDLDRKTAHWGRNVWISIDGLEYGLGMILHVKYFRAYLLEGYAVGPEDTSAINFETVRFAIASEPGRLPPNVSQRPIADIRRSANVEPPPARERIVSDTPSVGAFAIVPSNDLQAALPFWERLGFVGAGGDDHYVIMTGWSCEVHLTQAGDGLWSVPSQNPFGVFIRTPKVEEIAARVDDLIIRPGGVLRHREWGLYEVGIAGPDGLLVRVGWPSRLIR